MNIKSIILIIVTLSFFSCEDNGEEPEVIVTAEELIIAGWVNFETGEYAIAIEDFNSALSIDASASEAYSGIGWSRIRLEMIDDAQTSFLAALDGNYAGEETFAGLAAISLVKEKYTAAIGYAESILNIDPEWIFEHDNTIDYKDVWLIVATAYFHEGNFTEVEAAILKIDSTYSILENDSATWIVDGKSYLTYREALAAYLQSLPSNLNI
ncbi:MAG: hypothetical protein IIB40_03010 [Candidatus Marinimicrobia bacterium]|nr:hypothetical protein [Candidatus Neomarinimicrobiota bacterium]